MAEDLAEKYDDLQDAVAEVQDDLIGLAHKCGRMSQQLLELFAGIQNQVAPMAATVPTPVPKQGFGHVASASGVLAPLTPRPA